MTTVAIGNRAEQAAADWLAGRGYRILQRNFRRPNCEIDIVAGRQRVIYFVEVKYRSRSSWGDGLDYITAAKLRKMRRAAQIWVAHYRWRGEYQLAAVAVAANWRITDFCLI